MENISDIIIQLAKSGTKNRRTLDILKRRFAKNSNGVVVSNSLLLKVYHKLLSTGKIRENKSIEETLRIKKVRSLSGIVVVSVLTKPYKCPGKCIFCPTQENTPKSYIKEEPAVARAIMMDYHPFKQVQIRLKALKAAGHPTDKIDLRIIGGTWSFYPKNYQNWFIKECFRAANNSRTTKSLPLLQKDNERAKNRIIGIMIETRPDFINLKEIKRLRELGITAVELGVQSIYNDILEKNKRGHLIEETIKATRLLKDAGFKICYQMMPNLLGSNPKRDLKMFKELFSNPDFKPDYIKIYPCALLKEATLYKVWKKGNYKPYGKETLINLLLAVKKHVPYYCRIQRIIRDIPSSYVIQGGAKISNLRQEIEKTSRKQGWNCKCIRCREIKDNYNPKEELFLFRDYYDASQGKEIFLSFENKNRTRLYSLLRLRIAGQKSLAVLNNAGIIREVHTYGQMASIKKDSVSAQHKGLGKKLIKEAEYIVKEEFEIHKIAAISGIGARNYYKKLGYRLKDTYMIKELWQ